MIWAVMGLVATSISGFVRTMPAKSAATLKNDAATLSPVLADTK